MLLQNNLGTICNHVLHFLVSVTICSFIACDVESESSNGASGCMQYLAAGKDGTVYISEDLENWSLVSGHGNYFTRIAYGKGRYVAVGRNGLICYSDNGEEWIDASFQLRDLYDIIYVETDEVFVAVGSNIIITSKNGINWHKKKITFSSELRGIAYANNRYIAVGLFGCILVSSDTETWEDHSNGDSPLYDIAYGNGLWIAVGYQNTIFSSNDNGLSWKDCSLSGRDDLHGITYGNGSFVIVGLNGKVITTDDGEIWNEQYINRTYFNDVIYAKESFVIVGTDSRYYASENAKDWTLAGQGGSASGIVYGNQHYVIVGYRGYIWKTADFTFSSYEQNKIASSNPMNNSVTSLCTMKDGRVIAVGDRGYRSSSDNGQHWENIVEGGSADSLSVVIRANNSYAAVGEKSRLVTSTMNATIRTDAKNLYGIAYGNNMYVAVGADGAISYSPKLNDVWTGLVDNEGKTFNSVSFYNGRFIAVGLDNLIKVSEDGIHWTSATVTGGQRYHDFNKVVYGNNIYLVIASTGGIYSSANGTEWTYVTNISDVVSDIYFYDICYVNGRFICVGGNQMQGNVVTSTDGAVWKKSGLFSDKALFSIVSFYK